VLRTKQKSWLSGWMVAGGGGDDLMKGTCIPAFGSMVGIKTLESLNLYYGVCVVFVWFTFLGFLW